MANVLVAGGAGYLGGYIADRLIEAGYSVRVHDNLLYEEKYLKSVYGDQNGLLDEESSANSLALYAKSKVEADRVVAPTNAISFRLGTICGGGDRFSRRRLDLVVNLLTVKAWRLCRTSSGRPRPNEDHGRKLVVRTG